MTRNERYQERIRKELRVHYDVTQSENGWQLTRWFNGWPQAISHHESRKVAVSKGERWVSL